MANDPSKICREAGCTRHTGKGLSVCWAHYARNRRGSTRTGPVQEFPESDIVSGPRLAPKVLLKLKATAEAQETSVYELQNSLVHQWFVRLEEFGQPWLCGEAKTSVLTRRYRATSAIRVERGDFKRGEAWLKQTGYSWYWLTIHILEDWWYWWFAREDVVRVPPAPGPSVPRDPSDRRVR